ncbi:DUF488 domain-containing protein [Glycocaulis sp.]
MLTTIGYESAKLDHFIGTLLKANVSIVVDIRDRAQSRRKGFSKSALSAALAAYRIGYVHYRELGDPKAGREAARAGNWSEFNRIYTGVLNSEPAESAIHKIVALCENEIPCLLCYERDHRTCHRKLVSDKIEREHLIPVMHLGVQEIEPALKRKRPMLHSGQSVAAPL